MRKILISILLIFIFFVFIKLSPVDQESDWQEYFNQSFDYFYNGEYDVALRCLEKAQELNPGSPLIHWRLTYALWLKIDCDRAAGKDIDDLKAMFYHVFDQGIALCNFSAMNTESLFYLGGLYANRVLFKQAIGERNKSILKDTEKSREYLAQIKKTEGFYYEACGYLGIFNYGSVLMSGIQKFIVKRFGHKWDEKLGLEQIKDAIKYSRYADDIKFLYKDILMNLVEKNKYRDRIQETIDLVDDLAARYPRNSILKNDLKILEGLLQK